MIGSDRLQNAQNVRLNSANTYNIQPHIYALNMVMVWQCIILQCIVVMWGGGNGITQCKMHIAHVNKSHIHIDTHTQTHYTFSMPRSILWHGVCMSCSHRERIELVSMHNKCSECSLGRQQQLIRCDGRANGSVAPVYSACIALEVVVVVVQWTWCVARRSTTRNNPGCLVAVNLTMIWIKELNYIWRQIRISSTRIKNGLDTYHRSIPGHQDI